VRDGKVSRQGWKCMWSLKCLYCAKIHYAY